ncbi:hypothetical protein LCGC14_0306840 [marine sediment metagenome]|uniref:Holin n=1 Tax=marine sediment metagenome TaxID=412755 RepID=A0A0F9TTE6_9ZZZZ
MDPKSGKQSTEFWLSLAFGVVFLANGTEYVDIPWDQFIVLAGVFGVYTGGRSHVKAQEAKAMVAAALNGKPKP